MEQRQETGIKKHRRRLASDAHITLSYGVTYSRCRTVFYLSSSPVPELS